MLRLFADVLLGLLDVVQLQLVFADLVVCRRHAFIARGQQLVRVLLQGFECFLFLLMRQFAVLCSTVVIAAPFHLPS